MSPESLEENRYNFSTDMWAIGIILYELLKGDTPWYGEDDKQLFHRIMNKPISKLLDGIPE
jgi:serine/threonine protein kinase